MISVIASLSLCALAVYHGNAILACIAYSIAAYFVTLMLIPYWAPSFMGIGLSGSDLNKADRPVIPETMGAVCGIVYLFVLYLFTPSMFYQYIVTETSGGGNRDAGIELIGQSMSSFPHSKLAGYLSGILSLQSMLILGVADDLFDIRWRHKILLPAVAAVPLLIVYYVDFGVTFVMIPPKLQPLVGVSLIDLGIFYYVYMASVTIFCPNAINIFAGVNGLEVGQSVIIGICTIINDLSYISRPDHPAQFSHLMSFYLVLPFLGVSLALLKLNWFPAKVFVGDTYCYMAGMVFAVAGILGHFSKTMLLFFGPQVFNFIYSAPQLFSLIHCPRHRLPRLNEKTGRLEPSRANLKEHPPGTLGMLILHVFEKLHLVKLWRDDKGNVVETSNLTFITLVLVWFGPLREDILCTVLMVVQGAFGLTALGMRHYIAAIAFGSDNL
ncbi:hypothetical protein CANCADRAFT_57707 [Tortispora caseinolytica NRRL Y-17796]|uniref:UDP-N-acetylglucosamine--dolichyl-phosphate N-acetylglucosaminephosphotransferase n=1 Tax=Tortispora caseinolytica NRRL Y-17796 TaxID=767744 RepID=A0A1E4T9S8_9ASCO|nr:hypothetical protein CANCADRAFT_57707 [Tortispora caseinolytica NRRL Y-17796]